MLKEKPTISEQTLESMVQQKIGTAKILASLDQTINSDSAFNYEALEKIVEEGALEYKVNPEQLTLLKNGLTEFFKKHEAVNGQVEKFKKEFGEEWKKEFFKYCFGQYPEGQIDLRQGPITIYWQCEDLKDYNLACGESEEEYSGSFGNRKSLLDEQPEELIGTIIVEYSGHPKQQASSPEEQTKKSQAAEIHEKQHIIFDMLTNELDYRPLNLDELDKNSTLEEVQIALRRFLDFRRLEMERAAKNEIMAFWRDGEKTLDEIRAIVLEKGSAYDNRRIGEEERVTKYLLKRFGENYRDYISKLNIKEIWQEACLTFETNIAQAVEVLKNVDKQNSNKKLDCLYLLRLERADKWERTYNLCKDRL
jgi:hypothetical protein